MNFQTSIASLSILILTTISATNVLAKNLKSYSPFQKIDSIVEDGIRQHAFPGCQVLVVKDGKKIYDKCFGYFTYDSIQEVQSTTIYDLASLSKTTGTLLAVMKLYDEKRLKLEDKASDYLRFLRGTNKENITISELLFHESGLPAGLPFYELAMQRKSQLTLPKLCSDSSSTVKLKSKNSEYKPDWVSKTANIGFKSQVTDSFFITNSFHSAAMQMLANCPVKNKTYLYSCLNFILLKEIVETITETSLDEFLDREFYHPMGLKSMSYLPLRFHSKEEIAPTVESDFLRNNRIQGFVHDPDAAFFGGISGNAGLFATTSDVASVYQMMLDNGNYIGKRYLSEETCKLFTTKTSPSGRRGLGFDKPTPENEKTNPCCKTAPSTVYGHTGYTGTCCWVDPTNKIIYVFLSNRTYPIDGVNKLAKLHIRPKIQEAIYQSIDCSDSQEKH